MSFVQLQTMFTGESTRTVDALSAIYNDPDLMRTAIRNLTRNQLNTDSVTGKRVLLKPNWVSHDRKPGDSECLRTNNAFLLAAVEVLLELKPLAITIGDAPIQGCQWSRVVTPEFTERVDRLSVEHSIPITVTDFRRVTFDPKQNILCKDRRDLADYSIFDLGVSSSLEPITSDGGKFRVTDYDPGRLAESHSVGRHRYCIIKEFFDADIVISLPKIKTHQKTGLTGALKNLVGINGDKDYLPHHRIGGTETGGDCYPGHSIFRRAAEWSLDNANRRQGKFTYWMFRGVASVSWRLSRPTRTHNLGAAWYGNDTCWRMVADINRIAQFGRSDGTMADVPQRTLYSLCDGIVGGQGDGPLNPEPLRLGMISFANNNAMTDICFGTLMAFDVTKIPLLRYGATA